MRSVLLFLGPLFLLSTVADGQTLPLKAKTARPVYFDVSPPLRDMVALPLSDYDRSWKDGVVMNFIRSAGNGDYYPGAPALQDPGLQRGFGPLQADTTIVNFDAQGNGSGYVPPDTHGDVGFTYYFQVVNCSYAIYNKNGDKVFGPRANSTIWLGMPNNSNDGDAIVLFDEQANRWLFSQFSLPNGSSTQPFYQMIAVSQTSDPAGSWYRYQYEFDAMPDYPKFGVWQDGYYMSTNDFVSGMGWVGNGAFAYNRDAMLAGDPDALRISFTLPAGNEGFTSLLPADCDGTLPDEGTPNYFTYIKTYDDQHLGIIEFHADWNNPANSTFGNTNYLAVNPFYTLGGFDNGIPQLDSPQLLETLSDRLMYRQQYRRFPGYASMVLNHSVSAAEGVAGIRWYELRNSGSGWTIYQQSTYAPDNHSRWMGSIAQDSAGTIALGYSVSGTTMYPAIRYTGRRINDPLNTMTFNERSIVEGGGSQTGNWSGRSRWGDYSAMNIDPSSPTTFWYTTEYYPTTSGSSWQTRVGSFTYDNVFSSAASANPIILCSSDPDSIQLSAYAYGGSENYTYSWSSIPPEFVSGEQNPRTKPAVDTRYIAAISDGTETRFDTVSVRIVPYPTVYTAPDTTVCWYSSPVPLFAVAENYNRVVWGTMGDGWFSDKFALCTCYFPGTQDITSGLVDLVLMVQPMQPCSGNIINIKHLHIDPCTGMEETTDPSLRIEVTPNPAHREVTVTLKSLREPSATLTVISPTGQTLCVAGMDVHSGEFRHKLDVSNHPSGVYQLQISTGRQILHEKLIIRK